MAASHSPTSCISSPLASLTHPLPATSQGALATRAIAKQYGIPVILHTDHCQRSWLPWFDGLMDANEEYYKKNGTLTPSPWDPRSPDPVPLPLAPSPAWLRPLLDGPSRLPCALALAAVTRLTSLAPRAQASRSSRRTCSTSRRSRSRRTWARASSTSPAWPSRTSCSRWSSASPAARRTASTTRTSTRPSSTRNPRRCTRCTPRSTPSRAGASRSPRPSATCTVHPCPLPLPPLRAHSAFRVACAGVYSPGNVQLTPDILHNCQKYIKEKDSCDAEKPATFVFHGTAQPPTPLQLGIAARRPLPRPLLLALAPPRPLPPPLTSPPRVCVCRRLRLEPRGHPLRDRGGHRQDEH